HALRALECEARGAFLGDDPVERAAIVCLDGVGDEVRRDLAIRVEDVAEHLAGVPLAYGGQVRAYVLAKVAGPMAGRTGGLENRLAATRVALHRERGLILRDDVLARAGRGITEEFRRQFLHLWIGAAEQEGASGKGNLVGRDDAVLDGPQQRKEAAAPAEHGEHDLGANGRRGGTPVGKEQRRGLRSREAADGRHRRVLDFLRLFRFEQAGERGVDALEVVEGEEANGAGPDVEWRLRIGGGLGGLRKKAVNRAAGVRVQLDAAEALAGTLQAFAEA